MRSVFWFSLTLLVLLLDQAPAQTPLRWKLQDRFYAEVTTSQQQNNKLQGRSTSQSRDMTLLFAVQPLATTPNGMRVIEMKVEAVKVVSPAQFKAPEEVLLKALEGAEFKVTLGPDWRVREVEGAVEVVKKLDGPQAAALPAAFRETLHTTFDGLIGFLAGELFVPLPEKPVQKGGTWEQKTRMRLPLMGSLDLAKQLTYEGKGRLPYQNMERVTAQGNFRHTPEKGEAELPGVKIVKAEIKAGEYKGTLHFDAAAGRLVHAEVKTKTDVAVSMVVNKQKTQTQGLQEETLTIRTFDKKPQEK